VTVSVFSFVPLLKTRPASLLRFKNPFFFVGADYVYACSQNPIGESFYSRPGIDVGIQHPTTEGKPVTLLITKGDSELIEWFEKAADGFFVPVPRDRFAELHKQMPKLLKWDYSAFLNPEKKP
jgi:hypothetical protein